MHGRPERARQRPRERATEGRRQRLRNCQGSMRLHKRKPRGPKRREPRLRWRLVRERAQVRESVVSSCAQQRRPLQDDLAKRRSTAGALGRSSLALHGKRCVIWRVSSVACRGCMFDCVRAHRMSPWTCAPQRRHVGYGTRASSTQGACCASGAAWRVVFHAESGRHAHYRAAHRRQTRPGTRVGSGSRRANCPASGTPSVPPPPSAGWPNPLDANRNWRLRVSCEHLVVPLQHL